MSVTVPGRMRSCTGTCQAEGVYQERRSAITGAMVWTSSSEVAGTNRILPDGCMDLIWVNGALVVSGPDLFARTSASTGPSLAVGLRLPPGLAPLVFGVGAHELVGSVTEFAALVGDRRAHLLEEHIRRVSAAPVTNTAPVTTSAAGEATMRAVTTRTTGTTDTPGLPSRFLEDEVRQLLVERTGSDVHHLNDGSHPELRIPAMLARRLSVADVAAEIGYSPRQLQRRSLEAFGYGTKTLDAILRFQRAAELLRTGAALACVAATAGYADQSHLSRSITRFAGVSPTLLQADL
jgi:AraC-like DNA-binding protein